MNEDNLWEWLRDVVLPIGHYSRIESPDTAPGFPDVHYSIGPTWKNATGTIELKYARQVDPPFPHDPDRGGLRKSQLKWIRDQIVVGGTVWIIAEVPHETAIYVIPGKHARRFNGAPLDQLDEISTTIITRQLPEGAAEILRELLNG